MKNRNTIKQELKAIAKSKIKLDKKVYDYFMDNINIGMTDKEIVNMIYNILFGYYYEKNDFEFKIADFLLSQTSLKNHRKFNKLYFESFVNNCNVVFELLIKHNVVIVEEVVEYMEGYLGSIEFDIYHYVLDEINDYRDMLYTIKRFTRKQKIEKIRRNRAAKTGQ